MTVDARKRATAPVIWLAAYPPSVCERQCELAEPVVADLAVELAAPLDVCEAHARIGPRERHAHLRVVTEGLALDARPVAERRPVEEHVARDVAAAETGPHLPAQFRGAA